MATLMLRLQENWKKLFDDADAAAIALAIVAIVSERVLRDDLDPALESLIVPLPPESLGSCNISSIATATGFNRETTRRKVDQLVEAGLIIKDGKDIRLAPGFTQQDAVIDLVKQQLDEIRKTADELIRAGVLSIED